MNHFTDSNYYLPEQFKGFENELIAYSYLQSAQKCVW